MILVPQYEFPVLYNDSYLNLLVRDPNCIFAYWEITQEKRREVTSREHKSADLPFTLRVYDLTGVNYPSDAHYHYDLVVHSLADTYFITELKPNRSYCVELGIVSEGRFYSILRSNVVQTPSDSFADGSEITMRDLLVRSKEEKADFKIGSFSSHGIYGSSEES